MKLRPAVLLTMLLLSGTAICNAGPKERAAAREQKENTLKQWFENCFSKWDRNHDGTLALNEINTPIEDPAVRGDEAAVAVLIRKHFVTKEEKDDFAGVSRAQLLAYADENGAVRSFTKTSTQIKSVSHTLFLPADPNLQTFHQGGVGDCYLLSVIGTFVSRDPKAVRSLIKTLPDGNYEIHFASEKLVKVSPPTDAELVMGAREGNNRGIWLSVLEKAYASIREENRVKRDGEPVNGDDMVAKDFLGGGRTGPVIALLTGHKTAIAPINRWQTQNPDKAVERLATLLTNLTREHRLMAVGTGKNPEKQLPKHIAHGHAFGILGYDATRQMVRLFNPWGNDVTPTGRPGLVNGYFTHDGIFEVPIREFLQTFGGFTYETDKPSGG